jgi:hypothetical protein
MQYESTCVLPQEITVLQETDMQDYKLSMSKIFP